MEFESVSETGEIFVLEMWKIFPILAISRYFLYPHSLAPEWGKF